MNEAELLFSEILSCDRLSLYLNKKSLLDRDKLTLISSALKRRLTGEPIQYILGKTEFMGLEFKITPDVLIPRPETEILVETVIEESSLFHNFSVINILDLGTGSGCVAISLAKFLQDATITAVDISDRALEIAKENAKLNNVNVDFIQSDLFTSHELRAMSYELIVSNPPYIPSGQIDNLQPEIKFEPSIALDGGRDGLDFYRKIIACAPKYLKNNGLLIMEMGFNQKKAIKNIFQDLGNFEIIKIIRDYNDIERVVVAEKR